MNIIHLMNSYLSHSEDVWSGMIAGLLIGLFLLICFQGYQLRDQWIAVIGFVLGFYLTYWIGSFFLGSGIRVLLACAVGGGLGFASHKFYRLGLFLLCAGITMFAVYYAILGIWPVLHGWVLLLVAALAGALAGALAILFDRMVVILVTGFGGGICVTGMIFILLGIVNPTVQWLTSLIVSVGGCVLQFLGGKQHRRR